MCNKCNVTPCVCEKKRFFIPLNPVGFAQPVNPDFCITFNKSEESRLNPSDGRFQIIFQVPDGGSKVQRVVWKFPSMSHRDTTWDNLINGACLGV